ncbi:Zinc finger, CCHC-type [Fagus crenata]
MDSDALLDDWRKFSLTEDEAPGFDVEEDAMGNSCELGSNCLVGKLVTAKYFNRVALKTTMLRLWGASHGITVTFIDANLFVFQFPNAQELDGSPWLFDNCLLILNVVDGTILASQVQMQSSCFWGGGVHCLVTRVRGRELAKSVPRNRMDDLGEDHGDAGMSPKKMVAEVVESGDSSRVESSVQKTIPRDQEMGSPLSSHLCGSLGEHPFLAPGLRSFVNVANCMHERVHEDNGPQTQTVEVYTIIRNFTEYVEKVDQHNAQTCVSLGDAETLGGLTSSLPKKLPQSPKKNQSTWKKVVRARGKSIPVNRGALKRWLESDECKSEDDSVECTRTTSVLHFSHELSSVEATT